jgi:hypothetical protein
MNVYLQEINAYIYTISRFQSLQSHFTCLKIFNQSLLHLSHKVGKGRLRGYNISTITGDITAVPSDV